MLVFQSWWTIVPVSLQRYVQTDFERIQRNIILLKIPGLIFFFILQVGFDEALRLELEHIGAQGVFTTVICPYFIQSTGMFDDVNSR